MGIIIAIEFIGICVLLFTVGHGLEVPRLRYPLIVIAVLSAPIVAMAIAALLYLGFVFCLASDSSRIDLKSDPIHESFYRVDSFYGTGK
jgi:hypothetical protein